MLGEVRVRTKRTEEERGCGVLDRLLVLLRGRRVGAGVFFLWGAPARLWGEARGDERRRRGAASLGGGARA